MRTFEATQSGRIDGSWRLRTQSDCLEVSTALIYINMAEAAGLTIGAVCYDHRNMSSSYRQDRGVEAAPNQNRQGAQSAQGAQGTERVERVEQCSRCSKCSGHWSA